LDALRSEAYKIHSSFDPTSYKPWEMSQETANYLMHFGSSPSADSREFESNAHSPNTPANPSIQETTLPLSQHPGVEIFRKVYQEALRNNNVSGATSMTEKDILDRVLFEMTNLPPFEPQATPLIGRADQPKIHYHCGINNSMQTVNEGGACLYKTLGKEIAVQPHWIHQEGMGHGASMVAAELIADQVGKLSPSTNPYSYPDVEHDLNWLARSICYGADQVVTRSDIQKSIDYEVELLAKTSREILEQNNPKLKQVHVAFSNGGYVIKEAIKQLPEEYKDTIIVITIGSTRIIEDSLGCHETYNVIGEKDWASRACNGGERAINAAGEHATIHMIPQAETESIVQGHYFMQPDYQDKIYDILQKDIIGVYEMY
jgi:hypothetical protein